MKGKGNNLLKKLFLVFLVFTFILGLYMYSTDRLSGFKCQEGMENPTESKDSKDSKDSIPDNCPNLLINKGNVLLLYNTKLPEKDGENPIPFYNLDEYINYLEIQRSQGKVCPILYMQKENNTQGTDVYRIRPSPFDQQGGLPPMQMSPMAPAAPHSIPSNPIQVLDATRDNPPYNSGNYAGFDPIGLHIGQYTEIDKIHDSTSSGSSLSDNPMDPNWGGVLYTHQAVDNGKYADRVVTRPNYLTPKGGVQFTNARDNPFTQE